MRFTRNTHIGISAITVVPSPPHHHPKLTGA